MNVSDSVWGDVVISIRRFFDFRLLALGGVLSLLVVSTQVAASNFQHMWPAEKIATLPGSMVRLNDKNQNVIDTLPIATVRMLISIRDRITRAAGISAELVVVDGSSPNAFATKVASGNVIGFNIPMLRTFGNDEHALAAVMGHEVAHLIKGHGSLQQDHDAVIGVIGLLAGIALDYKLGRRTGVATNIGQNLAAVGTTLASRSFSRDHEREADEVGLRLISEAGYDPSGVLRLWAGMPYRGFSFFSTHPPTNERLESLRTLATALPRWVEPPSTVASARPVEEKRAPTTYAEYKEESSAQDDPFILGLAAFRAGRFEEARKYALVSADSGDPRGQLSLGYFYLTGSGGSQKDYAKAREYLELAERGESLVATTALGVMHENGLGVARSATVAATYYEKASNAGFPDAMARLAMLKATGNGTAKDIPAAFELATKASEQNSLLGHFALGVAFQNGIGTSVDYTKARELFEKGSARGHPPSNVMLGGLYSSGRGVPQDFKLAATYYKRAADRNDPNGKAGLGFLHLNGNGVERNPNEARRLFEEAYQQGNSAGALGLGHLYRGGVIVTRDPVLALAYYEIAARKGLASGIRARDDLVRSLDTSSVAAGRAKADAMLTSKP